MTTFDDLDLFPPVTLEPGVGELAVPAVDVATLLAASVSANTGRNYRLDWTRFTTWCTDHRYTALPRHPRPSPPTSNPRPGSVPRRRSGATPSRR